jgi:hypothetical protein
MGGKAAFRLDFEPVVNVDEAVKLLPYDTFAEVVFIDQAPYLEKDFGALNAGLSTGDTAVTELDQEDNVIGQFRIEPVDTVHVIALKQPKARPRWTGKKSTFKVVDGQSLVTPPSNLSEFFQYKDTGLYMDIYNYTSGNLSTTKVAFYGWLLTIELLTKKPDVYTPIPVTGYTEKKPGSSGG